MQLDFFFSILLLCRDQRRLQVPPALERLLRGVREAPRRSLHLCRGQRELRAGDDVVGTPTTRLVPESLRTDTRIRFGNPFS